MPRRGGKKLYKNNGGNGNNARGEGKKRDVRFEVW